MVPHETIEQKILSVLPAEGHSERIIAIVGVADAAKGEALVLLSSVDLDLPQLACEMTESGFRLLLPEALLEDRPLSAAALADEADEWKSIGLRLEVKPLRDAGAKAA